MIVEFRDIFIAAAREHLRDACSSRAWQTVSYRAGEYITDELAVKHFVVIDNLV